MKVSLSDEQIQKFPEEYRSLLKNEMSVDDLNSLGNILIRHKLSMLKYKLMSVFNKLRHKVK